MEFRTAFPAALLLGAAFGALSVAVGSTPRTLVQGTSHGAEPASWVASAEARPAEPVTWDIPVVRNERVEKFVDMFSASQSDRMALYLKRSGRYEGMIRSKLRARGMPQDLIYLTMIESGFDPTARSSAQAVGLWQFIEGTGRDYGLRVDRYVDERRDPEKSTDAALRYLSALYERFGSWNLAAAAYNSGEGRVSRVMLRVTGREKGEERDFWRIRSLLPSETRDYVPLIVAAAIVGKQPEKYGLGDVERWMPVETETVDVPGGTKLSRVAKAAGLSEKEIRELNPQLYRGITPAGEVYPVKVPVGRAADYAANAERVLAEAEPAAAPAAKAPAKVASATKAAPAKKSTTRAHTVSRGENLRQIAQRNGVSVAALKSANGLKGNVIQPGQRLSIPR